MTEAQPRTVADAPPTCDRDCTKPALYAYQWSWGEKGVCCEQHRFLLQQSAEHLGGATVSFAPLAPTSPAPVSRDERARFAGELYAANAEIEDLKTRGLDLYRENTNLTSQLQSLTVRQRETSAQLDDAKAEAAKLQEQLQKRDAELGQLTDEVSRLRTLAKFSDPTTAPKSSRGRTPPPQDPAAPTG